MKCPYCAEEVKDEAIVCPLCRRDLIFFQPLNARLDALEHKVATLNASIVKLQEAISSQRRGVHAAAATQEPFSFYIAALLIGGILSGGSYGIYLWTHDTTESLFLWISILTPLIIGIWIGLVSSFDRGLKNYFLSGLTAGILNSIGVSIALSVYLREAGGRIDWLKVLFLYVLPPFFLITFGGFVGDWLKRHGLGQGGPPSYARSIAQVVVKSTQKEGQERENQIEQITKLTTALAPILTFIGSVVTAWLAYLAASR